MQSARERIAELASFSRLAVRGKIGPILCFEFVHRTLVFLLFAPVSFYVLRSLLDTWGKPSIGNFEIAAFLLSWPGVATMIVVGGLYLAQLYFQTAGLILIIRPEPGRTTIFEIYQYLFRKWLALFRLGLLQMAGFVAFLFPAGFSTAAILNYLWNKHDINALVILRPPVFWLGVGCGVVLVGISAGFIIRLFLRWFLALPALLLDQPAPSPRQALYISVERTNKNRRLIGIIILCWALFQLAVSVCVIETLKISADWFLDQVGTRLVYALPATMLVLAVHAMVLLGLSVLLSVGFTCVILYLDQMLSDRDLSEIIDNHSLKVRGFKQWKQMARHPLFSTLLALAIAVPAVGLYAINQLKLKDDIEIIAHRAGGALAPENTVAAVKNAVSIGAQWAEIDVQLTSDNKIIVAHDTDLRRLGGLDRTIGDSTLALVQSVDVGSKFSEKFKGEKIPTLEEFLNAGAGKIHVLIELKPHNDQDGLKLAAAVVKLLRERNEIGFHRICSQSYESVVEAKRLDPGVTNGFIAAQALGRLDELKVDFLMIDQKKATRRVNDRAQASGKLVLAWTVDDPAMVLPLLDRGVDGIITDNPPVISERLNEIRQLNTVQRLVLRARNALAD